MVIKLLLKFTTFWALLLTSAVGWGQCPTSVDITSNPGTTICAGETITFTANPSEGDNHTYQWQINGINVSGATDKTFTRNNLNHNDQIRVVVRNTTDTSCSTTSNFVPVTVNPIPAVTTTNTATICSGTGPNISLTASTSSSFSWTVGTVTGGITGAINGNGASINQTLTNPSSTVAGSVEYIVTPTSTAGNCEGEPYKITVIVNPKPTVTTANTATICSGASPNITLTASTPSTFSWTLGSITGGITGASASSGSAINQTLTNPSNTNTGTVEYIVTPTATTGNCAGEPYKITVTVNPKPTVTTANTATICSGASPGISLTASTPSTFSWTLGSITGGITGASAGSGATINQTLTNPSSTTTGKVEYIVTPTATTGNCAGEPYKITVTVNPTPTVTTANTATICSGASPGISLTASTPSTFSWTLGSITGGITGASAGSGATINQTLTNPSSTTTGKVEYIVTPTATTGNCAGEPYKITVTVNPTPTVTTANTATICSGASPNIALTASTPSTFSWTVGNITGGITGASAGSGSTISQTLTNPGNSTSGTVQYIVTPTATAGSCPGTPYTITVTVNPRPTVTTPNTSIVCSGFGPNIPLTASTPSSFSWTIGTITGGITGASASSGSTINQPLTNPSNSTAGTVQYIVTPTATTGSCPGTPYTITVTVNPTLVPSVSITSTSTSICTTSPSGSTPVTFTATPVNPGTNPTYQWKNGTTNVGTNSATYTANSLANGSQISVVMTSTATCAAPVSTTSNVITMTGFTPPAAPVFAASSGNVNVSSGICPPVSGLVYTVTGGNSNVSSYNWELPNGWKITGGEGTNSITVDVTGAALSGGDFNIMASAKNACGISPKTTFTVNVNKSASVYAGLDASICKGGSIVLSGESNGYAQKYRWTATPSGGTFSDEKILKPTFTPPPAYTGTISLKLISTQEPGNINCPVVADEMILTVNAPPAITAQPSTANQTICLNSAATPLSVTATGAGLTYQWYRNTSNSNTGGTLITGATSSSYTPLTTTAGTQYYYVTVGGTCSPAVTSTVSGAVTVNALPAVTAQPSASQQTLCLNATATPLSVTATGAGLTYQWYSNTTNSNTGGTAINGATSTTYTPLTSSPGTLYYYAIVSGTCTPAVTTNVSGAVTVNAPPEITVQPSTTAQVVCPNAAATPLAVTTTGAGLTYQWYSNTTSSNTGGTAINGATSASYTPATTKPGTEYYYVIVSGTCTPPVTSNVSGAVTVNAPPAITAHPSTANEILCLNDVATELSVTATGDGLTYQWYSNSNSSSTGGTAIDGATSSSYKPVTTTAGTLYYYAVVNGTCTPSVTSNVSGAVTVNEAPAITVQPSTNSQTLCLNDTANQLEVTATGAGLTYQWYSNTIDSNSGGTSINGATSSTYTPETSSTGTLYYYVVISGACTPAVTSNVSGAVTVNAPPAITAQPSTTVQNICLNEPAVDLSVTATGEGLSYQWYSNSNDSNTGGTLLPGATSSSYTPLTTTAGTTYYYVVVTGSCSPEVRSNVSGAITVNEPVVITKDLDDSTPIEVCAGFPVEFSIEATGTGLTYEWTRDGNPVGTNSPTLNIAQAAASDAGFYTVLVKGTAPCADVQSTKNVELRVNQSINITSQPTATLPVCLGESSLEISVVATGNISEYLWRKNGIPISDGTKYSGLGTPNLIINDLVISDSDSYDVVISSPEGSCSQIISTPSKVTVYNPPTADAGGDIEVCSTVTTVALGTGATSENSTRFEWTTTNGLGTITQGNNPAASTYAPAEGDLGKTLEFSLTTIFEVEGAQICSEATDTKTITIVPQPLVTEFSYISTDNAAVTGEFCETDASTYSPHIAGNNLSNGTGQFSVNNTALPINTSTGAFTPNGTTPGEYLITYTYTVTSEEAGCEVATKVFTVTIGEKPVGDFSYEGTPFCSDATNPLPLMADNAIKGKFSASPTGLKFVNDTTGELDIAGSTPGTYTVTNTIAAADGCAEVTATSTITINAKPAAPGVTDVAYCHNAPGATALTATADSGATLNWYESATIETALTTAPIPNTASVTTTPVSYWVSQTSAEGCESERAEIKVTINALPVVTAQASETTICLGSSAQLSATGGVSYIWYLGEKEVGNQASISHIPEAIGDYIYKVLVTDANGCENFAEVNVKVDALTVAGSLTAPSSVCANNPNGTLTLSGHTGNIIKWETKPVSGSTWTVITGNTNPSQNFSGLTVPTDYRVTVKNGVCSEATVEARINIDPVPVGGKLAFTGLVTSTNDGRIMTICQGATNGYRDINLSGQVGTIVAWKYSVNGAPWVTIAGETGNILSASKIQSLNLTETTVFRVEIGSGACTPNAFSQTAILSVIPTNIEPQPVTVSKEVICLGDEVTLSSETGYSGETPIVDGGTFDNAGLKNNGWRFGLDGNSVNFETNANNTNQDFWSRATPHNFNTANYNTSPYSMSPQLWDAGIEDGNKGFALVSGDHTATMETNIFSIGSMDQAIVTFDQAYNLTPEATITVEISKDGGATYEKVLFTMTGSASSGNYSSFGTGTPETRPKNKMVFDLGDYLGQNNLRIRFTFDGSRDGDLWAVDAIEVPEGPRNVTIEWNDYTNPGTPIYIGNTNSVQYKPTKVGLNIFEVKTKLVFDTAGNACDVAENAENISVFAFDKYTTAATKVVEGCGSYRAQLGATVAGTKGGDLSANFKTAGYTTPDGYVGEWLVEGGTGYTLINPDPNDTRDPKRNPDAILTATAAGEYTVSWKLISVPVDGKSYVNTGCLPTTPPTTIVFTDCIALDFDGVDDYVDLGEEYTGDYSIEAWIRPEAASGTVISTPQLEINMNELTGVTPNNRWYHIAVDSDGKLYIDGIDVGKTITKKGSARAFIGARWNAPKPENHFSGWIEEVRIWNGKLDQEQIQFLMNQRLQNTANIGVQIPMPAPGMPYTSLAGYYQLLANNILNGGYTPDLASPAVNGKLRNMETFQENTAPLPYTTSADGKWTDENATWTHWDVWDIPHANGINGEPILWNIVRTSHNIVSDEKDIIVLGLIVESAELEIADPANANPHWENTGQRLEVTKYLRIDGVMDLVGESQLIQPRGSIVDGQSSGYLERDQQGTASSFNYNYWSSPVSAAGNAPYTVAGVMLDGTSPTPGNLDFGNAYAYADGGLSTPRKVSTYWLHKFHGTANDYFSWTWIGTTGSLKVGEGFSMKGTAGSEPWKKNGKFGQNYTFKGLPNNGDINLTIAPGENYLVGNPYPSAIDANKFIADNLKSGGNANNVFNGTVYFWSHFSGATHYLEEYIGGYATYNLSGGVVAYANDDRINATGGSGGDEPKQFIPVGQAFFVNTVLDPSLQVGATNITIEGGAVNFNNGQRIYERELDKSRSVFHSQEKKDKSATSATTENEDVRRKIWLKYKSPKGYHRQLLVTADANATDGFDLGYDAPMIEDNVEDMYWFFSNYQFVIQGVSDFNLERELDLGMKVDQKGTFTISIDNLLNIPDEMDIFLRDGLLEVTHDLRKTAYTAESEPGVFTDRFKLVFKDKTQIEPEPEVPVVGELDLVYYNDGKRQILVKNPELLDVSRVYLFNVLGQQVHVFYNIPEEAEVKLPVERFNVGVYFIKLYYENGIIEKKFIFE